jgi:hypothetical protein
VFSEPDGRIAAERVEFDLSTGTGVFYDASGIMAMGKFANQRQFAGQEPDVYFYGEKIEKLPERKYRITKGAFTTCVQPTPRWELTSGSVSITLDDYAIAKGTVLRVKGMPLLYLPVITRCRKASAPPLPAATYGTSTCRARRSATASSGRWAAAATPLMHDWFTRSGQGVGGEYRYIANAQSSGNIKVCGCRTKLQRRPCAAGEPEHRGAVGAQPPPHAAAARPRPRGLLLGRLHPAALSPEHLPGDAQHAVIGSMSGSFGRPSPAPNARATSTDRYVVEHLRQHAAVAASLAPQMLSEPIYASANTEHFFNPNRQVATAANV